MLDCTKRVLSKNIYKENKDFTFAVSVYSSSYAFRYQK
jgi:hypothetical protein